MIAIQSLAAWPLLAMVLLTPVVLTTGQRQRWRKLLRRSRWLIVVLAAVFLMSTPGEAMLPGWPATREGLLAALDQGGRFVLILAAVAWLLDRCSAERLMVGLYCLAAPLRRLGFPAERAAARLVLVLDELEHGWNGRDWRVLLVEDRPPVGRSLELELPTLKWRELALCGVGVLMLVAVALGAG